MILTKTLIFFALLASENIAAKEAEWNVPVTAQLRIFPNVPQFTGQTWNDHSLLIKPVYRTDLSANTSFHFEPFYRIDENDSNRTHFDLRETSFKYDSGEWEWTAGVAKVFWGVTETQHLVDIVNQDDYVDQADTTEKLGQPMLRAFKSSEYGNFDFFLLLGFRERAFPGLHGRLRPPFPVESKDTIRLKKSDVDFAARWNKQFGNLDLALSAFAGNSREPILAFNTTTLNSLYAIYDDIRQYGVEAQYTANKLILKFEGISRTGLNEINRFNAFNTGLEYPLSGFKNTDLGILLEYSYDNRAYNPNHLVVFEDDYFLGLRLTLNDAYESNLFLGAAVDAKTQAGTMSFRYNRRINDSLSLNVRTITFFNVPDPANDALASVQNDSFYEINLTHYFLF